jgi:hypothetical protein
VIRVINILDGMVSRNRFEFYISQNDPNKCIDVIVAADRKEKIGQDLLTQQISSFWSGHQSQSEPQMQHEPIKKEDDIKSRASELQLVDEQRAQSERGDLNENSSQSNVFWFVLPIFLNNFTALAHCIID